MTLSFPRLRAFAVAAFALLAGITAPVSAQGTTSGAAKTGAATLAGRWSGTVTVQIGDSTINAPVLYNFTEAGAATSGTAMVPGQGTGPVSNVVRNGANVKFRVTAKQGQPGKEILRQLEHDGTIGSDGVMSGFVTLDGKPVAKFRIAPMK